MPPREEQSTSDASTVASSSSSSSPSNRRDNATSSATSRPNVRFNEAVKVVLIPHRTEYIEAKCDLWYRRLDVFRAQRMAMNEIRLIALFQNISLKEAKKKLYQPDMDPEAICWDYLPDQDEPEHSAGNSPVSSPDMTMMSRKSMKSKKANHTVVQIPPEDEEVPFFSPTKLHQHALPPMKSTSSSNSKYDHLHFCVVCNETIPLRVEDPSSNPKKLTRHLQRSSALQTQGLGMITGCLVFTISLVGFYYVNNSFAASSSAWM